MNKFEEKLAEMIEKAMEVAEKTGQFVVDQAPDLIQQFLTWKLAYHSIIMVIMLILVFLIPYILKTVLSKKKEKDYSLKENEIEYSSRIWKKTYSSDENPDTLIAYKVIKVAALLFLIPFFINLVEVAYILVAPKIYLIEYFIK